MRPHDDDVELTPAERAAFAALPRARDPGRLLEERTVRALRAEGVLRPRGGWRRARGYAARAGLVAASAAAVFLGGIAVGQQMGARAAAEVYAASTARTTAEAAMLVQQTGSAYVTALGRLAELSEGADAGEGGEVAARLLRAAADELVRIAPDDPVASGILAGYDREAREESPPADAAAARRVVWF